MFPGIPSYLFIITAESGNLNSMIYLHQHGLPWHIQSCCMAAWQGYYDCKRYAQKMVALVVMECGSGPFSIALKIFCNS